MPTKKYFMACNIHKQTHLSIKNVYFIINSVDRFHLTENNEIFKNKYCFTKNKLLMPYKQRNISTIIGECLFMYT